MILKWRDIVQFMLWMTICVLEGIYWEEIKKVWFELWLM